MKKYYETLGIRPTSSLEDIEMVYRILLQKYNPNAARTLNLKEEATKKTREIEEAYRNIKKHFFNDEENGCADINQELDYEEKNEIYKCIQKSILNDISNSKYIKFPQVNTLKIDFLFDKIKVEGTFNNKNNADQIVKTNYIIYLDHEYKVLKLDFRANQMTNKNVGFANRKNNLNLSKFIFVFIFIFALLFLIKNYIGSDLIQANSKSNNSVINEDLNSTTTTKEVDLEKD
ncbi:MAG: DnaJ domain-containing protein [Fusobacteriaceae bacterium]|nr:DnaJ domain-containing protein [Fusobacteriaceae bacterium]